MQRLGGGTNCCKPVLARRGPPMPAPVCTVGGRPGKAVSARSQGGPKRRLSDNAGRCWGGSGRQALKSATRITPPYADSKVIKQAAQAMPPAMAPTRPSLDHTCSPVSLKPYFPIVFCFQIRSLKHPASILKQTNKKNHLLPCTP